MAESKRTPGPFSFCPKHKGSFYASCKCPIPGTRLKRVRKEGEGLVAVDDVHVGDLLIEETKPETAQLDV